MEAFFLPASDGARFCVYHPPRGPVGPGVVFAHAFAEEMNKSRHVVAQASRRLAAQGFGVLLIDLYGCGDSTGAFDRASWDAWREDIREAARFMQQRGHASLALWGMRLGCMLAAQCAADMPGLVTRCLLWQPVPHGEAHLAQFLRLRLANAMLSGARPEESGKSLRMRLAAGESIEIAGYLLSPTMATALEQLDLQARRPPCPVDWFEVVAEAGRPLPPASLRVISSWQAQGTPVVATTVAAEPFWGATHAAELVQCQTLVDATARGVQAWT